MVTFDALVRGRLGEKQGGIAVTVPRGRCKVQVYAGVVGLAWSNDGGGSESVTLTAQRFEDHLEAGAILLVDPAQLCAPTC
jgi:hypothetical protein